MKRLIGFLVVVLVLVCAFSAMAESVSPDPTATPVPSKQAADTTNVDTGDSYEKNSSGTTTTTAKTTTTEPKTNSDDVLDVDLSKYVNNPDAVKADFELNGEFTAPVIFESLKTTGTNSKTLTITQQSLTEEDKVAVFVVYKVNGKIMRVPLTFKWVDGKLVCEIPANVAEEIEGKEIDVVVIGDKK